MLERIELTHFKCFSLLKLPLAPLTILAGANASGKSSLIQAIVLLHQTMREQEWSTRLYLNGGIIRLGSVRDIIDQDQGRNEFAVGLLTETMYCRWRFSGEHPDLSMNVANIEVSGSEGVESPEIIDLRYLLPNKPAYGAISECIRNLNYLTAERTGPKDIYDVDDPDSSQVIGAKGENTASLLNSILDDEVNPALALPDVVNKFRHQLEIRMQRFFPGFQLELVPIPHANAVTMGIRTSKSTDFHRPIHTGFAVTQVLPIVVAALSSTQHQLLIIENPEVHLHPAGQANMGLFLSEVASAGVQVVLETHSDHLLNGVRRAVKSKVLKHEDAAIHFFRPRHVSEQDQLPQVESPVMDVNGDLDNWPTGFFDQFDKDTSYFAGWE